LPNQAAPDSSAVCPRIAGAEHEPHHDGPRGNAQAAAQQREFAEADKESRNVSFRAAPAGAAINGPPPRPCPGREVRSAGFRLRWALGRGCRRGDSRMRLLHMPSCGSRGQGFVPVRTRNSLLPARSIRTVESVCPWNQAADRVAQPAACRAHGGLRSITPAYRRFRVDPENADPGPLQRPRAHGNVDHQQPRRAAYGRMPPGSRQHA